MHPNAELLTCFYNALAARDGAAMGACYTDDASFTDSVFRDLKGEDVRKMWRLIAGRVKDLKVEFNVIAADDEKGRALWVATYSFADTGNKVVNRIESEFTFRDGKIASQVDSFDFYRWARQALGLKGTLLGWLPATHNAVSKGAMARLKAFKG